MRAFSFSKVAASNRKQILATDWLDWPIAGASAWTIVGLYLDGWAHVHSIGVETFFTPWHAVLYSGFFVSALVLIGARFLQGTLPACYELSFWGVFVFAFGGVADMIWHLLFGIESSLEALFSPTHLIIVIGGALIATGPLRAAWHAREDERVNNFISRLPVIISLTVFFSQLTFFTSYASPFADTVAGMNHIAFNNREFSHYQALGIASVLLQAGLISGLILFVTRRWLLPFGSFLTLFGVNAFLMTVMNDKFISTGPLAMIVVAILGGLLTDLLVQFVKPSTERPREWRILAAAVPTIFFALYFFAILIFGGTWWSIHLWSGAIVLAGLVGLLMSFAFVPPQFESEQR